MNTPRPTAMAPEPVMDTPLQSPLAGTDKPPQDDLILVLALSDLSRDPRVMRQILWLHDKCRIIAAGFAPPSDPGVAFVNISHRQSALTASASASASASAVGGAGFWPARLRAHLGGFYRFFRSSVAAIPGARYYWRLFRQIGKGILGRAGLGSDTGDEGGLLSPSQYLGDKLAQLGDYAALAGLKPTLILANDLDGLVLARQLFPDVRVVFDAHEYPPLEYNSTDQHWLRFEQPARVWACQTLLPQVSGMSTVCAGIAREFERNFQLARNIEVITNAPLFEVIRPHATGEIIRVVHHGVGSPLRKIELMAEAVRLAGERFELYLILVKGDADYIASLQATYAACANIKFLPPVPMPEIAQFISQFDLGMFILEPEIFNYQWALPNKFFEFIQARLAIAVGPSPEMAKIVHDHDLGIVAADFSAATMATALQALTGGQVDAFKRNADRCARIFCAEANREKMLRIIDQALATESGEGVSKTCAAS